MIITIMLFHMIHNLYKVINSERITGKKKLRSQSPYFTTIFSFAAVNLQLILPQ
jgi:hypothetical protein